MPGRNSSWTLRLAFARKFSESKGDNCLLTLGPAYIDLPFSHLIA